MDEDGGWLSQLMGGGGNVGATSVGGAPVAAPEPIAGTSGPTSVGGAPLAAATGGPTVAGALGAMGGAAPAIQKAMAAKPVTPPPQQIQMPQPHQQPYAQALAQIMAKLNAQNPQMQPQGQMPQGTQ
jgi:hypothetical protein